MRLREEIAAHERAMRL